VKLQDSRYVLAFVLIGKLCIELAILSNGFVAVSGDDFFRSLIAYEWSKQPFICATSLGPASVLWMPLHFWIVGALLKILKEVWLVPILVNLFFSLGTIVVLFTLVRDLFGIRAAFISAIAAGFIPWHVWLSISGIATCIFQFSIMVGLLFVVKIEKSEILRPGYVFLSAAAFTFSTMLRPEGWLFSVVFVFYLCWKLMTEHRDRRNWYILPNAMLLTSVFMIYWLYFNYANYGDALHFMKLSKVNYLEEAGTLDSFSVRLFKYPALMFIVSPSICLLAFVALFYFAKGWIREKHIKSYVLFVLLGLALLVAASVFGSGTRSTPQRYVVLYVLLLTPFAGEILAQIYSFVKWRKIVVACIVGYCFVNVCFSYAYPRGYMDEAEVGRFLKDAWKRGSLSNSDLVCTERSFRIYAGIPYGTYLERMYSLTKRWAIQVLSNHPDNFVFGIMEDNKLVADVDNKKIQEYFQKSRIRLIIVNSEDSVKRIPQKFRFCGTIGGYVLFSDQSLFPDQKFNNENIVVSELNCRFNNDIALLGYSLDKSLLPRYATLFMKTLKPTNKNYSIVVEYVDPIAKQVKFSTTMLPRFGAYNTSKWRADEVIEQRIYFSDVANIVSGKYVMRLSLLGFSHNQITEDEDLRGGRKIEIGPFAMILSKREVIKSFLKGNKVDASILGRVLLSL